MTTPPPFDAKRCEELAAILDWTGVVCEGDAVVLDPHEAAQAAAQLRAACQKISDLEAEIENLNYELMGEDL